MFIDQSMTRDVISVEKETSVLAAHHLMREHQIRHLPVVDADERLIGIVTDRDIRSAIPYELIKRPDTDEAEESRKRVEKMTVGDIMTTDVIKITPTDTIQDALLLVQMHKVGALPVVGEEGRLKGFLSVRDLLRAFVNVLGIGTPGTLVGILVEEKVGQLKKIVDAITEEGISFGSVLVARHWQQDKRAVFAYLLTQDTRRVKKKLTDLGFEMLNPLQWYMDQLPGNE
jgi:acetoin utilization protein AcuB